MVLIGAAILVTLKVDELNKLQGVEIVPHEGSP